MKKNEEKITPKFNTCLVLMKDIEYVVKFSIATWKNIYNLHQQSDFIVHVNDKEDEGDKEANDIDDDEDV